MEAIKDVGEIVINGNKERLWIIENYFKLPQEYNTVIRSPRFRFEDRDWYMEVYPNGRRLSSSSGWFGIGVLNLNADSNLRSVILGITGVANEDNCIVTVEESSCGGFYCCLRFLPRLLLRYWKDLFAQGGYLYVFFSTDHIDNLESTLLMQLSTEDVQKFIKENFENASIQPSTQVIEENEVLETDIGELFTDVDRVNWIIPKFCDLPKDYNAVIRSPRFRFKDRHWYIEVYPNGHRLYSSLGWFGIKIWNLNSDSNYRNIVFSFIGGNPHKNWLFFKADSYGNGCYCCVRLFPTSLLNSWTDVVAARGNLHLFVDINDGEYDNSVHLLQMQVETKYVHKWYNQKFKITDNFIQSFTQAEGEIVKKGLKQNDEDACTVKATGAEEK